VNSILFLIFLVAYFLDLTGLPLHQWLGLFVGAVTLLHLLNHWQWVKAITKRFFNSSSPISRINYLLDVLLCLGITTIIGSGLVISTWFGVNGIVFSLWRLIHVYFSLGTLVIIFLKLFLHWKTIACTARQFFPRKRAAYPQTIFSMQCENPRTICRRDALRTLGMISVAGGIVLIKTMTSLKIPEVENLPLESQNSSLIQSSNEIQPSSLDVTTNPSVSAATTVPNPNQTSSNCVVSCPNGCSYPGRCRRYVDNNNNQRCDLGECL
jgi:hypothetical protein